MKTKEAPIRLSPELLRVSELNPRKKTDPESIAELANDIKMNGQIQPVIVRKVDDNGTSFYEVGPGQRRFLACKSLGIDVLCLEADGITEEEWERIMLSENLQRADMHPLETMESMVRLLETKESRRGEEDDVRWLSSMVSKPEGMVRKILSLRMMIPKLMEFYKNRPEIGFNLAVYVANKPESWQETFMSTYGKKNSDPVPRDLNELERDVRNNGRFPFLENAVFDLNDASLSKERGACNGCSAAFSADMFNEGEERRQCGIAKCFEKKTKAHLQNQNKIIRKNYPGVFKKEPWEIVDDYRDIEKGERKAKFGTPYGSRVGVVKRIREGLIDKTAVECSTMEWGESKGSVVVFCTDKKCPAHGEKQVLEDDLVKKEEGRRQKYKERMMAMARKDTQALFVQYGFYDRARFIWGLSEARRAHLVSKGASSAYPSQEFMRDALANLGNATEIMNTIIQILCKNMEGMEDVKILRDLVGFYRQEGTLEKFHDQYASCMNHVMELLYAAKTWNPWYDHRFFYCMKAAAEYFCDYTLEQVMLDLPPADGFECKYNPDSREESINNIEEWAEKTAKAIYETQYSEKVNARMETSVKTISKAENQMLAQKKFAGLGGVIQTPMEGLMLEMATMISNGHGEQWQTVGTIDIKSEGVLRKLASVYSVKYDKVKPLVTVHAIKERIAAVKKKYEKAKAKPKQTKSRREEE